MVLYFLLILFVHLTSQVDIERIQDDTERTQASTQGTQTGTVKALKMVHLVYRHGARSPIHFYPNDPHQEKDWPDGAGQLTQYGMQLEYNLGKFFKQRYMINTTFVNQRYLHKEVYIQSSDRDRCIQSAQSQLAALYPPKGYQVWNTNIPWQPIPVHSVPRYEDIMMNPEHVYCPRLQQVWENKKRSHEYRKKLMENIQFLNQLSYYSGMKVDLDTLGVLHDASICERAAGMKPPKWMEKVWARVESLNEWLYFLKFRGDDEWARLLGGTLLGKINENMKNLYQKKSVTGLFKLNMFSGHDSSIMSLAAALDVEIARPIYASTIMIELYHSVDKGYFVEVYFRNNYKTSLQPLKLKKCGFSCPLAVFLELTKIRTTSDRSKICGVNPNRVKHPVDEVGAVDCHGMDVRCNLKLFVFVGCTVLVITLLITLYTIKRSSLFIPFGYKQEGYLCDEDRILIESTNN